jgi:hypothetical protein
VRKAQKEQVEAQLARVEAQLARVEACLQGLVKAVNPVDPYFTFHKGGVRGELPKPYVGPYQDIYPPVGWPYGEPYPPEAPDAPA